MRGTLSERAVELESGNTGVTASMCLMAFGSCCECKKVNKNFLRCVKCEKKVFTVAAEEEDVTLTKLTCQLKRQR